MLKHKDEQYQEMIEWYIENSEISNKLEESAKKYNVSFTQYCILVDLAEKGCLRPSELSTRMKKSLTSISRTIKILSNKNLITKGYTNYDDQRKVNLTITDLGISTVHNINKILSH